MTPTKLALFIPVFVLAAGTARLAGASRLEDKIEHCVQEVESWSSLWLQHRKTAPKESIAFLGELNIALEKYRITSPGIEVLELREELEQIPDRRKKNAHCQKILHATREWNEAALRQFKANQLQSKKIPAATASHFQAVETRLEATDSR